MPLVVDESVAQHVLVKFPIDNFLCCLSPHHLFFPQRIRDGALEWMICEYEGKEKIKVTNSGNGNFDEFKVKRRPRL